MKSSSLKQSEFDKNIDSINAERFIRLLINCSVNFRSLVRRGLNRRKNEQLIMEIK